MWRKKTAEQGSEDRQQNVKAASLQFHSEMPEWVLNCFIVFHIFAVTVWLLPPNPFNTACMPVVLPYMASLGIWQTWSVFAPDPKTWTGYITAMVTFKDGTQREWAFPRLEKLDYVTRVFKDKYRKWANDCVNDKKNARVWPDTCRYIARQYNDKQNPPVSVSLIRHWQYMNLPELKPIEADLPTRYHGNDGEAILYTYKIETAGPTK